jgi:muramoyltetrapeptide carboxypeptidase
MITIPPYLKEGHTIGIVAPAGFIPIEKIQTCIKTLEDWGYKVKLGATTHSASKNYFSGTDEERLNDLQQLLDDKEVNAILCARGGYGVSRIIDGLSFKKFNKHPKWLIGFSDVTVLHAHLVTNYKTATLHAPMAGAFNDNGFNSEYVLSLKAALEGKEANYHCAAHDLNIKGKATGELVGGNLTLLTHLLGTASDIKTKDKLLFIEDIGELLYHIDRMMLQLKRSGKLKHLAGLIVGGFTDCRDTERPFGKGAYEIVYDHVKEYDYPVCFNFPVSHHKENYALKVGGTYHLKVAKEGVRLHE